MLVQELDAYFEQKEAYLDGFIDTGSDQELFTASYIHGHFSVVAAKIVTCITQEQSGTNNQQDLAFVTQEFEGHLKTSIENAIADKELSSDDAKDVLEMLDALIKHG